MSVPCPSIDEMTSDQRASGIKHRARIYAALYGGGSGRWAQRLRAL